MLKNSQWHKTEASPTKAFWDRWIADETYVEGKTEVPYSVLTVVTNGSPVPVSIVRSWGHDFPCTRYLNVATGDEIFLCASMKKIAGKLYNPALAHFIVLKRFGATGDIVDLTQVVESTGEFPLREAQNPNTEYAEKIASMKRVEALLGKTVTDSDLG
ncbi:hypothetical protein I4J43_08135 [Corynebacterium belfantii]|uniref:hypothetical protein n=1 Tax=Corynebacterium belfantii TaxID=2014537 RepID=UPI0018D3C3BE|nr:hypothetical protein [Corynebacterium belfantii]MBG9244181.1 hypothetical protein [Corynebacterium belfantii]